MKNAPAIPPADLATFEEDGDGNLIVTLQRYGALKIVLQNHPMVIEVSVARDEKKNFRCVVATSAAGDEKQIAKANKANGGKPPGKTHVLLRDGSLYPIEQTNGKASTGRKALESDHATTDNPGGESSSEPGDDPAGGESTASGEPAPGGESATGESSVGNEAAGGDQATGGDEGGEAGE